MNVPVLLRIPRSARNYCPLKLAGCADQAGGRRYSHSRIAWLCSCDADNATMESGHSKHAEGALQSCSAVISCNVLLLVACMIADDKLTAAITSLKLCFAASVPLPCHCCGVCQFAIVEHFTHLECLHSSDSSIFSAAAVLSQDVIFLQSTLSVWIHQNSMFVGP